MVLDIYNNTFEKIETFDPIDMISVYLEKFLNSGDPAKISFAENINEKYKEKYLDPNPTNKTNRISYNINDNHDITLKITRDREEIKKYKEALAEKEDLKEKDPTESNVKQFREA